MRLVALVAVVTGCGYSQPLLHARDAAAGDGSADAADAMQIQTDAMADARQVDGSTLVTIQQVQSAGMAPGTPVTVAGVIITAIDAYGTKVGDLWLEEPGGGQYSGVHVFGVDPSGFAVGDVVTLSGMQKDEFALASDTSGRTETELVPQTGVTPTMTKTGTAAVPAPAAVDALAIQQMTEPAQSQEWNKWDGVLVILANVKATTAPAQVGSDPTLQSFSMTGNLVAESNLAAFPSGIAVNTCFANVTGLIDYFFSYQILPRSTSATVLGGTACP